MLCPWPEQHRLKSAYPCMWKQGHQLVHPCTGEAFSQGVRKGKGFLFPRWGRKLGGRGRQAYEAYEVCGTKSVSRPRFGIHGFALPVAQCFSPAENRRAVCSSVTTRPAARRWRASPADPAENADTCGRCLCCVRSAAPPCLRLRHTSGKFPPTAQCWGCRLHCACCTGKICPCLIRHRHLVGAEAFSIQGALYETGCAYPLESIWNTTCPQSSALSATSAAGGEAQFDLSGPQGGDFPPNVNISASLYRFSGIDQKLFTFSVSTALAWWRLTPSSLTRD